MSTAHRLKIADLALADKIRVLGGRDAWTTHPASVGEREVIPSIKVTDGPVGARGDSTTGAKAVCLPAPIAMAATFDTALVGELGRLIGIEARRKQSQVLLAPTLNLARHTLGGRNFESFGEEPNLVAAMARSYIAGVQESGVAACAKHLVANDAEWARLYVDTVVDAQTLREVYLIPFEAAVGAGVGTVMSAYPRLNGVHCSENAWLLNDVLRREWGFDGVVISDWGAAHDGVASLRAGLDLEMPGPAIAFGQPLIDAVERGEIAIEEIDVAVARLAGLAERTGAAGVDQSAEQTVDDPTERLLARTAAVESMVLVRNTAVGGSAKLLPLDPSLTPAVSVAVIGPNADPGVEQGGGSALVPSHRRVSPLDGIVAALSDDATGDGHRDGLGEASRTGSVRHEIGCLTHRYLPKMDGSLWAGPLRLEKFACADFTSTETAQVTASARTVDAFIHGYDPDLGETLEWSWRWTGTMRVDDSGEHRFGLRSVGRARAFINGELVVDNWSDSRPGHSYFQKATAEQVGSIDLTAGAEASVVVEWSRGDDNQLAGLSLGHLPPVDEAAMMADAVEAAAGAEVAVVVVGLDAQWETESHDRLSYDLPGAQNELVSAVASANPNTVVVVNAGSPVAMPWFDEVAAVLVAWYPGQEFGGALADVLFGTAEPGGRLPVTYPTSMEKSPTATNVPHPDVRPELPDSGIEDPRMEYTERLHIGQRWYQRFGHQPLLPFGFGLGYTDFDFGTPELSAAAAAIDLDQAATAFGLDPALGPVTVSVPVTNTGTRTGKCVVQVYVRPGAEAEQALPESDRPRPRVLAGFASVSVDAGETSVVDVAVPSRVFCRWSQSTESGGWVLVEGSHDIDVGRSSIDVVGRLTVDVARLNAQ